MNNSLKAKGVRQFVNDGKVIWLCKVIPLIKVLFDITEQKEKITFLCGKNLRCFWCLK